MMKEERPPFSTIGQTVEMWQRSGFTGREFERRLFANFIERLPDHTERILHIHGTGGTGKSFLLDRLRSDSETLGAGWLAVDLRDGPSGSAAICRALQELLGLPGTAGTELPEAAVIEALNARAVDGPLVLALDHYEEIGAADQWVRERLLPSLHANTLVVLAGRYPLQGPWRTSPAWSRLIVSLPLGELTYEEACDYLRASGIVDERSIDAVWTVTLGHPLHIGLLAQAMLLLPAGRLPDAAQLRRETADELLRQWLSEADGDELHSLVLLASLPRVFHQELLEELAGHSIPLQRFDRLIRLSFVTRTARGWRLHEPVRETVRAAFTERQPDRCEQLSRKVIAYFQARVEQGLQERRNMTPEISELFGLIGNPIMRAHFRHSRASANYVEALPLESAAEAEAYVRRRLEAEGSVRIQCADPESQALFRYTLSARAATRQLEGFSPSELLRISPGSLQGLRGPRGQLLGLFACVPIHTGTLDYLRGLPAGRACFGSLQAAELEQLRAPADSPAGWMVLVRDLADPGHDAHRSDMLALLLDCILTGSRLYTAAPELPYYIDAHASLGFELLPAAAQGASPAAAGAEAAPAEAALRGYVLDTRAAKLASYVSRMTQMQPQTQQPLPLRRPLPDVPQDAAQLTPREREVASWLVQGCTNQEIATALFISEAAVKKHVNAMLSKTGLKNRTQLSAYLMDRQSGR